MAEGKPGRGKNGKFIRDIHTAERDGEAARLRARGLSLREIADRLGFAHESGAHRAIARAVSSAPVEAARELRTHEFVYLDTIMAEAWRVVNTMHPVVSHGGKVVEGPDGQPLRNDGPTIAALNLLLKVSERRSKLLGLDAAKRYEVRQQVVTLDEIDFAIADLQRRLAEFPEAPERAPLPWSAEAGSGEAP